MKFGLRFHGCQVGPTLSCSVASGLRQRLGVQDAPLLLAAEVPARRGAAAAACARGARQELRERYAETQLCALRFSKGEVGATLHQTPERRARASSR